MGKKPWTMAAFAAVFVLIAGACSPQASGTPGPAASTPAQTTAASQGAGGPSAAPAEANLPKVPTGYTELDQALTKGADGKMPFAGKKVSIQT